MNGNGRTATLVLLQNAQNHAADLVLCLAELGMLTEAARIKELRTRLASIELQKRNEART